MSESVERLEVKRKDALDENWKWQRHQWIEDSGGDEVAEESLPPPGDSARGHGSGQHAPGSYAEDVSRPDDMKAFRHAGLTPASFAPARHLFMCCGRPIVVRLLMTVSPPPAFLITTRFDASGIGNICSFDGNSSQARLVLFFFGPMLLQSLPPEGPSHLFYSTSYWA